MRGARRLTWASPTTGGGRQTNGYYSISDVLSPEYVKDSSNKGVHKSGYETGTTTGAIDIPLAKVVIPHESWGSYKNQWHEVTFMYYNVTKVAHIGWGLGDSGAPVFAGNGSPYSALGMQVAAAVSSMSGNVCNAGAGCAIYFTRWSNIEQDLGFSINPITGQ